MSPAASPRILVVDDEPQIRRFLRIALEAQGYEVCEAVDGREALARAALDNPAVMVLDLGLPDRDGREVLRELRRFSAMPVIVLSVRTGEADKIGALDDGANDFVVKPFAVGELLARVRAQLRLALNVESLPSRLELGALTIDLAARQILVDGHPVKLSRKEFELLRLLALHAGKVLTHRQLLAEVWGPAHLEDTHYLRLFIGQIRAKLGDDPLEPRFIATEPGVGYRLIG